MRCIRLIRLLPYLLLFGVTKGAAQVQEHDTYFTKRDGLPADYISAILRDSRGYLWAGTTNGLARYDGYTFTIFRHDARDTATIAGNSITALCEDKAGNIWIGTASNGLSVYDYRSGHFRNYNADAGPRQKLRHNCVFGVYCDRSGAMWVALALQGVARYERKGDSFLHFLPNAKPPSVVPNMHPNTISAMYDDGEGGLWLGSGSGLHRLDMATGKAETFFPPGIRTSPFIITAIYGNGSGYLYIGTWARGLYRYSMRSGEWRQTLYHAITPAGDRNIVRALAYRNDSTLYIAAADSGLGIYHLPDGKIEFTESSKRDELGSSITVYTDYTRATWVSVWSKGLLHIPARTGDFTAINAPVHTPKAHFYSYWMSSIVPDATGNKGHYFAIPWAGTGLLYTPDNFQSWSFYPFPDAPKPVMNLFGATQDEQGKLWIARPEGILSFTPGAQRLQPETFRKEGGDMLASAQNVIADKHGGLYFANREGLWFARDGTAHHLARPLPTPNGENDMRGLFLDSRGQLWISTYYNGLARYDASSKRIECFQPQPGNKASIPSKSINDFAELPDGTVCVATQGAGLTIMHLDKQGRPSFQDFSQNAAINETVWSVDADKEGRLVFSTADALYLYDSKRALLREWMAEDGLPKTFYREAVQFSPEGDIIFGSSNKIYRLYPPATNGNGKGPAVFLTSLQVNGTPVMPTEPLSLPYDGNFLAFELAAPEAAIGGAAQYSYLLEGYDKDWSIPTEKHFGSYTGLPPGRYRLRVRAAGEDGVWREADMPLPITIHPPFWKRCWFVLLVAAVLIVACWYAVRYRIGVIRERQRLKAEFNKRIAEVELRALRAQMNPHFLFNSLNSINRFVLMSDKDAASDYLTRFSRLIRLILDNSKQDTVPLADELEALELYISMESLRFDNRFRAHINVASGVSTHSVQIPPLLLQPFVENAIWHGLMHKEGEGDVWIDVSRNNGQLIITIEDNGIGRKQAAAFKAAQTVKRKSHGLQITTDRLSMLNTLTDKKATAAVTDLFDESGAARGTRVTLTLPILQEQAYESTHG